jgi:hypothetical protein
MALDFPTSPTTGQIYTSGGASWKWDGAKWLPIGLVPATLFNALLNQQVFSTAGNFTYVPTTGMASCVIECVGGGAGGNSVQGGASLLFLGPGGGSGGYSRKYATAAQIGSSQPVTVGAAGLGATTGGGTQGTSVSGTNGGDTSVGTLCIAKGGLGAGNVFTPGGAGAPIGTGDFTCGGAPGESGSSLGSQASVINGGAGGSSIFGGGARGPGQTSTSTIGGYAATSYGSGGGGGFAGIAAVGVGGNGSPGIVIITEYSSNTSVQGPVGPAGAAGATGPTGPTGPNGSGYQATSTTSLTLGMGSQTITTQPGLAYTVGARVRMSSRADPTQWMEGLCTAYNPATGVLSLNVDLISGGVIVGGTVAWTTGDVKLTYKTVADSGWVMMNDGSIGDASSGGTTRANNDCQNLFTLFYNNTADADVPIQTSAGAATTRAAQGTAAAAWAAHCRLVLPKALGRAIAAAGAGSGLTGRTLGANAGAETHTQAAAEVASHTHTIPYSNSASSSGSFTFAGTSPTDPFGATGTRANSPAGSPMSILGPMSFLNIMVCL